MKDVDSINLIVDSHIIEWVTKRAQFDWSCIFLLPPKKLQCMPLGGLYFKGNLSPWSVKNGGTVAEVELPFYKLTLFYCAC